MNAEEENLATDQCARFENLAMFLPLDSPKTDENKSEPRMCEGIGLGTNERTEENLTGTNAGVVKCRTAQRKLEGSQRNAAQLVEIKGNAQQPVLGLHADQAPTGITDIDKRPVKPKVYASERPRYIIDKLATRMASAPRENNILKKVVEKYDLTAGCRACTEVITGRDGNRHTITQNLPHSSFCRARMTELMRQDETDKARVEKAEGRQSGFQEEVSASRTAIDNKDENDRRITNTLQRRTLTLHRQSTSATMSAKSTGCHASQKQQKELA